MRTTISVALIGIVFTAWAIAQSPPTTAPTSRPSDTDNGEPRLVAEQGEVLVRFEPGKGQVASTHLNFKREYQSRPLVLLSASGAPGRFVVAKTERLMTVGCDISGRLLDKNNKGYNAYIAYVVIGEPLDQAAAIARSRLPSEFGATMLEFATNKDTAKQKLQFRNRYKAPPLVLVSECDSSGTFLVVKTEKVNRSGCTISGRLIDHWSPTYRAKIAYIVVGDIADQTTGDAAPEPEPPKGD